MTRRRFLRILGLVATTLAILAALAAAAFFWVRMQRSRADLVIHGRIITMDPALPEARALAARGGRIIAVGDSEVVDPHVGWWTREIDLGDALVATRGFIEGPGDFLALAGGDTVTDDVQSRLRASDRAASARGITSFRDTAMPPDVLEPVKRMIDAASLNTRLWVTLRPEMVPPDQQSRAVLRGYGDHRLTVELATAGDVGATPDGNLVGTLTRDKLADITVLAVDATGTRADALRGMPVAYTIVGGVVVYESDVR
jgi:predicted amidohydrolase YtcJ